MNDRQAAVELNKIAELVKCAGPKYEMTAEELRNCANTVEGLLDDVREMASAWDDEYMGASGGQYVCLRVNPKSGKWWTGIDTSHSTSEEEYFGHYGPASITTLKAETRASWSPGPEDGYEWDKAGWEEKNHYYGNEKGDWCNSDDLVKTMKKKFPDEMEDVDQYDDDAEKRAIEVAKTNKWFPFVVSDRAVDPDLSLIEDDIREGLESIVKECRGSADQQESQE